MDFNALQHKLFAMDPVDPAEDIAKMKAQAATPAAESNSIDYINESAVVPEGSLQMDRDYSVTDFAALAGVVSESKQRPADQVRGEEPMPSTSNPSSTGEQPHPLKDRLVGEQQIEECDEDRMRINELEDRIQTLEAVVLKLAKERGIGEEENQGLYHNVNKRKKAGTSRSKNHPDAPSEQDWDNAAKTAKNESSNDSIKDKLYAALNKKMGV